MRCDGMNPIFMIIFSLKLGDGMVVWYGGNFYIDLCVNE